MFNRHSNKYQVPALAFIANGECVCSMCSEEFLSFYRIAVTHATFNLLAVAAFLESSNMPTAD